MMSPWGKVQDRDIFANGLMSVSTAGHGGIMVSKEFAKKHLSEAARRRAIPFDGAYWYEEDCDYAIPIYELPECWDKFFVHCSALNTNEERKNYLLRVLQRWNPDYIEETR